MVNKATASITRSREEPNLKRPMIPLRFISKSAELETTHGLAQLHLGPEGPGLGLLRPGVQAEALPLTHSVALGLDFLIYKMGPIMSTLCRAIVKIK